MKKSISILKIALGIAVAAAALYMLTVFVMPHQRLGRAIGRMDSPVDQHNVYVSPQQLSMPPSSYDAYSQSGAGLGAAGGFSAAGVFNDNATKASARPQSANTNYRLTAPGVFGKSTKNPHNAAYASNYNNRNGRIATPRTDELNVDPTHDNAKSMIKKSGSLRCLTDNYKKFRAALSEAVFRDDAYIASENEYTDSYAIQNELVLRVPSAKFDMLLNEIASAATTVTSRRVDAEEVTEQYTDLATRLQSKKETAKRYHDLLQRAKDVDEVLQVEESLRNLNEEIEATEGRMRFLSDRTEYSTISVNVYQALKTPPPEVSHELTMFGKLGSGFYQGWIDFIDFLTGLFAAWPKLLLLALLYYAGWKIWKRYKAIRQKVE